MPRPAPYESLFAWLERPARNKPAPDHSAAPMLVSARYALVPSLGVKADRRDAQYETPVA